MTVLPKKSLQRYPARWQKTLRNLDGASDQDGGISGK
jgi:hypothetical protein